MDYLEISAKTVDEAITKAALEMGVPSYDLDVKVISEGSSGFLGIGSKPAVVQVCRKEKPVEENAVEDKKQEPAKKAEKAVKEAPKKKAEETVKEAPKSAAPAKRANEAKKQAKTEKIERTEKAEEKKEVIPERSETEIAAMKAAAASFLNGVFKAMELPVDITSEYDKETGSLNVDFEGEDMGILIGKRGQTLDSLQYLVSLVVNKNQKNYVRVKLDTEDYRKRRKDTLENLAKNIASKVKKTRKSVSLEAMNPYERRIIHSALQNSKYVETYSEGNEPYRHVVVAPKKNAGYDKYEKY